MKKQGVMLEKKETIVESTLCKRGYTETTNYADGADHDADAAMMRLTTMAAMTVVMMR